MPESSSSTVTFRMPDALEAKFQASLETTDTKRPEALNKLVCAYTRFVDKHGYIPNPIEIRNPANQEIIHSEMLKLVEAAYNIG